MAKSQVLAGVGLAGCGCLGLVFAVLLVAALTIILTAASLLWQIYTLPPAGHWTPPNPFTSSRALDAAQCPFTAYRLPPAGHWTPLAPPPIWWVPLDMP